MNCSKCNDVIAVFNGVKYRSNLYCRKCVPKRQKEVIEEVPKPVEVKKPRKRLRKRLKKNKE